MPTPPKGLSFKINAKKSARKQHNYDGCYLFCQWKLRLTAYCVQALRNAPFCLCRETKPLPLKVAYYLH
jgi:hypothetical protein